jgi:hypothetical protein
MPDETGKAAGGGEASGDGGLQVEDFRAAEREVARVLGQDGGQAGPDDQDPGEPTPKGKSTAASEPDEGDDLAIPPGLGEEEEADGDADEAADDDADDDAEPDREDGWDRERQQRDQARAAERKADRETLRGLAEQNKRLVELLAKQSQGEAEPDPHEQARQGLTEQLGKLRETVQRLGDDSAPEDVVGAIRSQAQLLEHAFGNFDALAGGGQATAAATKVQAELDALRQTVKELEADANAREGRAWLDAQCDAMDKQFAKQGGPALRSDAMEAAAKIVRAEGYDVDHPPPDGLVKLALRVAYSEAAAKQAKGNRPKRRRTPEDPGRGGSSAAGSVAVPQTLEEACAGMVAAGELRE